MQRTHRNFHRVMWAIVFPVALLLLAIAIFNRPKWPEMEALPGGAALSELP